MDRNLSLEARFPDVLMSSRTPFRSRHALNASNVDGKSVHNVDMLAVDASKNAATSENLKKCIS